MEVHPAPSYANIYLARRLDDQITPLGIKYGSGGKSAWLLFKKFLDDLIKIPHTGDKESLDRCG